MTRTQPDAGWGRTRRSLLLSYNGLYISFIVLIIFSERVFAQTPLASELKKLERTFMNRNTDSLRSHFNAGSRIYIDINNETSGFFSLEQTLALLDNFIKRNRPLLFLPVSYRETERSGSAVGNLKVEQDRKIVIFRLVLGYLRGLSGRWFINRIVIYPTS